MVTSCPILRWGRSSFEACRRITQLPLDVHLMIEKPERYIEAFAKAGATGLTVHVETCPDIVGTLKQIKVTWMQSRCGLEP